MDCSVRRKQQEQERRRPERGRRRSTAATLAPAPSHRIDGSREGSMLCTGSLVTGVIGCSDTTRMRSGCSRSTLSPGPTAIASLPPSVQRVWNGLREVPHLRMRSGHATIPKPIWSPVEMTVTFSPAPSVIGRNAYVPQRVHRPGKGRRWTRHVRRARCRSPGGARQTRKPEYRRAGERQGVGPGLPGPTCERVGSHRRADLLRPHIRGSDGPKPFDGVLDVGGQGREDHRQLRDALHVADSAVDRYRFRAATSGRFGNSPRSTRYRRSPPPTTAVATSLNFTPKASFTVLTSAKETSVKAIERRGVRVALKEVRGAVNGLTVPCPLPRRCPEVPEGGTETSDRGR